MKTFTKMLVLFVFLTTTTGTIAQIVGIKAGLNLGNMIVKNDNITMSEDFTMNPMFHIGPTLEFPFGEVLSLETGLLLSVKGFNYDEEGYKDKTDLFYLDIPLRAKATFDIGGIGIYGAAGPYAGMGIAGKSHKNEGDTDIQWGSESEDDMKRLDFGLSVGAGVVINAIQLDVSYGLGLANISPVRENNFTIQNRLISLSVGYRFGGK